MMQLLLYIRLALQNAVRGCHKGVGKAIKFSLLRRVSVSVKQAHKSSSICVCKVFPHPARLRGSGQRKNANVKCESLYQTYELLHCVPAKSEDFFIALQDQYTRLTINFRENNPVKGRSQTLRNILIIASGFGGYHTDWWIDSVGTTEL
jgi:hypothetical protein